ncbi:MAG: Nif11-like leader peptide family natural product precursor [Nostoc desertorum CM1-VF14]|jgi:predicted ribosomally synthesized peptide with nif11-like leader|nr:Nif11-like leader peptide family natural product precursor [Nostoc desertorum CM1-VF14]
MSNKNVLDFFNQVEKDSELKQKVQAVSNKDDLVKLAQESGYSFTANDMKVFVEGTESDELNEEELEVVTGGGIREIWGEVKETARDVLRALIG